MLKVLVGLLVLACLSGLLIACDATQTVSSATATPTNSPATTVAAAPSTTIINLSPPSQTIEPSPTWLNQDFSWQSNWLKGIPCAPPCWEGVTPGRTSAEEAVAILQKSRLIGEAEIPVAQASKDYAITWAWKDAPRVYPSYKSSGGEAYFHRQDPRRVIFELRPRYIAHFKLADIIKAYGEPSQVFALDVSSPDAGSPRQYNFSLIYLQYGFIVEAVNNFVPSITPALEFGNPRFFVPGAAGFSDISFYPAKVLVPWQGFKPFSFYCRSPYNSGASPCDYLPQPKP